MVVRPLPYYIFAFALLLLFGYVFEVVPGFRREQTLGGSPLSTGPYISDVLRHAFLPALSLIVLGGAIWFQTMKLIVQNVNAEDFVQYAKLGGIKEGRIVSRYVIRNAMLPQITASGAGARTDIQRRTDHGNCLFLSRDSVRCSITPSSPGTIT